MSIQAVSELRLRMIEDMKALSRPAPHSAISCLGASPTPAVVRVDGSITQASEKPAQVRN
jgi:hypothetical protein